MRHAWVIGLVGCLVSPGWAAAAAEDLTVLPADPHNPPRKMMERYLARQVADALARRAADYEKVKTPADVAAWQARLKAAFLAALDLPTERTPLNPQVVAKIDRGDYRIEKVIFASQPRHFVTAILYLPKADPPYPGVLVPCGHSVDGKGEKAYQLASILLARNGIAALCYDPIGQGERHQILKPDGKALMGTTTEHQAFSPACVLLGRNVATYRIWDGLRAMDYLASRPEVDPKRLGCTGNSGGGTLTAYLMALDDRIVAAAPSCYLTTFAKVLEKIGPQDAEQLIYGQLAFGMDHADYVLMRAPRPTLMCTATQDFFDIGGAWDDFRQAKRFYGRLGFPERVDLVENDAKHGFNPLQRVSMVRWMRRWLLGKDDAITEPQSPTLSDAQIQVTPRGETLLLDGARSLTDLNMEYLARLQKAQDELWKDRVKALARVRELIGAPKLSDLPETGFGPAGEGATVGEALSRSELKRGQYTIEEGMLGTGRKDGVRLPALYFVPPQPREFCLYLDGRGKHVEAAVGGEIDKLAQSGVAVLAVDLRGLGETYGQSRFGHFNKLCGEDWSDVATAYLLGESYVGMRTADVLTCAKFLDQTRVKLHSSGGVRLIATGAAGVPALHAAALEPRLFASVTLRDSLGSFADVVRAGPALANQNPQIVHGALGVYDLPRLAGVLGDKLKIESPVTPASAARAAGKP